MTDRAAGPPCPPRLLRLTDAVGLWCLFGYAALAVLAPAPGEPELRWFFVLALWTGLPVFGLFFAFRRAGHALLVGLLVFWAVAFRLCGLAGGGRSTRTTSTATCGTATGSARRGARRAPRPRRSSSIRACRRSCSRCSMA